MRKAILCFVFGLLYFSMSTTGFSAENINLVVVGGPQGGAWYGLAGSLAKEIEVAIPGVKTSIMPGGGVGNIMLIEKGEAQLGTTVSHLYKSAVNGTEPYIGLNAKNLRALANIGTSDTCLFLVRNNYPANSIREIKDKKMAIKLLTTGKASTPALGTHRILAEYGMTPEDIKKWGGNISYMNYSDATQLIADGHADGIVAPIVPAIIELYKTVELKMLPLEAGVLEKLVSKYGYSKSVMKKDSYPWIKKDVPIIGEPNILLVNASIPDEIVYKITKLVCEKPDLIRSWGSHHAKFNPEDAYINVGGLLHPGSAKYFKENGYIK